MKLKLSSTAFWDTNTSTLDPEFHADFIIRKVFNFGLMTDIILVMKYYPEERIVRSLTTAPWLEKKTLSFCCNIFNLKPSAFRCTSKMQSAMPVTGY